MFVIAANANHKYPSFLMKILGDGMGVISVSLSDAIIFKTHKEASGRLKEVNRSDVPGFDFQVYELAIKQ